MALLLLEGFEAYNNGDGSQPSGWEYLWTVDTASGFQIQPGRYANSKAVRCSTNIESSRFFTTPHLGNQTTLVVGFSFYHPGAAADRMIVAFREGSNLGMNVRLLTTGEYQVRRGTTVLATTTGEARLDAWHHLEFKVVTDNSSGSYDFRIGGVSKLSDSGIDTQIGSNSYHDTVRFHSPASLALFDDIYIDSATLHGDQKVATLFVDSAGDDADFTASAGSNYECVDDVPSDDDTSYVESSTTDHQDLYGIEGLTGVDTIVGVQHSIVCRKTDATNYDIKPVCKSGTTESVGSAQTVDSTTFQTKRRILETDPDTSSPWTQSGIGSAQFGYRVG